LLVAASTVAGTEISVKKVWETDSHLSMSPDASHYVVVSHDKYVYHSWPDQVALWGKFETPSQVTVTAGGEFVIVASDGVLKYLRGENGDEVWTYDHPYTFRSFILSPDGNYIALYTELPGGLFTPHLDILTLLSNTGEVLWEIINHGRMGQMSFSPDGSYLFVNWGLDPRLYELPSREPVWILDTLTAPGHPLVESVHITRNAQYALIHDKDIILLYSPLDNVLLWTYENEYETVVSAAISDDGEIIAIGTEYHSPLKHVYFVRVFSSDGTQIWNHEIPATTEEDKQKISASDDELRPYSIRILDNGKYVLVLSSTRLRHVSPTHYGLPSEAPWVAYLFTVDSPSPVWSESILEYNAVEHEFYDAPRLVDFSPPYFGIVDRGGTSHKDSGFLRSARKKRREKFRQS
jgi:outer membrane protein assembly factor BamB